MVILRERNAKIEHFDLADLLHNNVIVVDTADSDHDGVTPALKLSAQFDLSFDRNDLNDPENGIKVYGHERRARQLEFEGKGRRVASSYLDGVVAEIAKTAERTKDSVFVVVARYDAMPDGYWTEYRKKEFAIRVALEAAKYGNAAVVLMGPNRLKDMQVAERLNVPYVTIDDWAGLEKAVSKQLTPKLRDMEEAGYVVRPVEGRPLRKVLHLPLRKPAPDNSKYDCMVLDRYTDQRRAEAEAVFKR